MIEARASAVGAWVSAAGDRLIEESFAGAARLRRARVFHPRGMWFGGRLRAAPGFERYFGEGDREVTARLSKAIGLPGRLPDAVGLGLRVYAESGQRWDFALASTRSGPVTRFVPVPVRSWRAATYGSLLPYRFDGGSPMWVFARPAGSQPADPSLAALRQYSSRADLEFSLTIGSIGGPPQPFADLRLSLESAAPSDDAIDPTVFHPPGVVLVPHVVTRIRSNAYRGSRAGRGAPADSGVRTTGRAARP
ncbi:phosphodiesterase [Nocardia veterana]|uniref:Phosphodiesterase n=1 Tax=Nocardia veterana TaxID=132249 RepID=A0A7X6M2U0_9NOCA|nr:phosphodiesterase [Nocardia veterana]NKY88709.1 phosphodiesterase [Nocardia veterana]